MVLCPEHRGLAPGDGIAATVEQADHLGDRSLVDARVEGLPTPLVLKLGDEGRGLRSGQAVSLTVRAGGGLGVGCRRAAGG
jgi:multiple sugar transport system ATP-binding protein